MATVTTIALNATENGTYQAPAGKAYTPINVNVEYQSAESTSW